MSTDIKLSKDKKQKMISLIKKYFQEERDEKLGDLASSMILDFFIKELAPEFYNQGVSDSYKYISDRVEELFDIQKY
ncbi:MAG: DUF2164 domain-containing protein [Tepidibacter sp.]|jgi:uncharacterized protein (DUF2164 family)|uniref:DUF2164 domain-containing protein n=1 Tax=Tepidibacter sp. TaxID=2529387 RepID=UPI0025F13BBB|nr:DUF2164 domain-containing protein [Tepidibacter sp.]MCT4507894.1 DUF2164 domain-containing protein [Tepidibacter sp.]